MTTTHPPDTETVDCAPEASAAAPVSLVRHRKRLSSAWYILCLAITVGVFASAMYVGQITDDRAPSPAAVAGRVVNKLIAQNPAANVLAAKTFGPIKDGELKVQAIAAQSATLQAQMTSLRTYTPAQGRFFGMYNANVPYQKAATEQLISDVGSVPSAFMFFDAWSNNRFNPLPYEQAHAGGQLPIVSWEPWQPSATDVGKTTQPNYSLKSIASGAHDAYLENWFAGARALGFPIVVRFAHEMNGSWYPWGNNVNGNQPGDYIAAWQHIVTLARATGTNNIIWLWSPNRIGYLITPLKQFYPGDSYVDWVGIVGYAQGAGKFPTTTDPFEAAYGPTIREIRTLSKKPLLLSEIGADHTAMDGEPAWVTNVLTHVATTNDVIGFVWFNEVKVGNWRLENNLPALAAFAAAVKNPGFRHSNDPFAPVHKP